MDKPWHVFIMEYSPAIKRNKILIHTPTWMNLKYNMVSFKKPDSKDYILFIAIQMIYKGGEQSRGCDGLGLWRGSWRRGA